MFRASFFATAARFLIIPCSLLLNILLSRNLSVDELGRYFLLFSLINISTIFCMVGGKQGLPRLLSSRYQSSDWTTLLALRFSIFLTAVVTLLCTLAWLLLVKIGVLGRKGVLSGVSVNDAYLVVFWLIASVVCTYSANVLRAVGLFNRFSLIERLLPMFLALLLVYVATWFGSSLELGTVVILLAVAFSVSASLGVVWVWLRFRGSSRGLTVSTRVSYRSWLVVLLPLWGVTVANQGISEAHIWILGFLGDQREVGIFGVAYRVSQLLLVPVLVASNICAPILANLWKDGQKEQVEGLLRAAATWVFAASGIGLVSIVLLGPTLLPWLFGDEFRSALPILLILLAGQTIGAAVGIPGIFMAMADGQMQLMRQTIAAGLFGASVSAILVSNFGAMGAAIGSMVAVGGQNLLNWRYCRRALGIRSHASGRYLISLVRRAL